MKETIILSGKIGFDPEDKTKKHELQGIWKRVAMVHIPGEVCEYYSWFLHKRYDIRLVKPLRNAHISFISDRASEMLPDSWDGVKTKWDNKWVEVELNLMPKSDGKTWWFNVVEESREVLQVIRNELGLGRPYFGMHMSLGYVNERNEEQSKYILTLIKSGLIT